MFGFGFLGKHSSIDEFETVNANIQYLVIPESFYGKTQPGKYEFNVTGVGGVTTPEERIITGNNTFEANDGKTKGTLIGSLSNMFRGYRYNPSAPSNPKIVIRNTFWGDHVYNYQVGGGRDDFFNVGRFPRLKRLDAGFSASSLGSPTIAKGLKGTMRSLERLRAIPVFTVPLTQFNTIEARFGAKFKILSIRANGIAGIINDRLSEAVSLEEIYLGDFTGAETAAPYSTWNGVVSPMTLPTSLDLSHCPNLKMFAVHDAVSPVLTSLLFNAAVNFHVFNIGRGGAINATQFRNAVDLALASNTLYKFYCLLSSQTWSRNFTNADFGATLVDFVFSDSILTGSITLTTVRAGLKKFWIGSDINLADAAKNDFGTVDISGLTGATSIDLSNSKIVTLTLPTNTVCQVLNLGGNKLDVTVLTGLVAKIQAMTALVTLSLSSGNGVSDFLTQNGQDSTNGFGNDLNLSALTLLTTLKANKCKLTGTLTIPTSIVTLYIAENNLTAISAGGALNGITELRLSNNPLLTFDFTLVPNIRVIRADGCAFTTIDLSGRTSTQTLGTSASSQGFLRVSSCPNLTVVKFPSDTAKAIIAVGSANTIELKGNPALASLVDVEKLSYNTIVGGNTRSFLVNSCALNIDLKIGVNNFLPTQIAAQNNAMSQANVDTNIGNIWTNRRKWDASTAAKSLDIAGTNAAPTGTFQAPTGYKTVTITGITKASTAVVTVSAIGTLANDDKVRIHSVVGMTQVNGIIFTVKNISGNTFQLYDEAGTTPINSTAYTTYFSSGFARVEGTPASVKEQAYSLVNVYQWTITMN